MTILLRVWHLYARLNLHSEHTLHLSKKNSFFKKTFIPDFALGNFLLNFSNLKTSIQSPFAAS